MIKTIVLFGKFILAITIFLLLHSCNIKTNFGNGIDGNGNITTEERKINDNFTSIEVNSGIEVVVEQSNDKFVSVETDSNIQKIIDIKVINGVLTIEPTDSYNTSIVKVTVRMPKIEALDVSSSANINSIGTLKGDNISIDASSGSEVDVDLSYDSISLDASSGSSISAKGIGLKLETNASSGAEINAFDLMINEITADVSSGANTEINPIVKLKASASSGGNIIYKNNPKSISKYESSGGNIGNE